MLPADYLWLKQQFKDLRNDHLIILQKLEVSGTTPITPELEEQVRKAHKLANKIDQKVPDTNVPPGSKT